ncbi:LPS biosynthesis protein, partial [Vibrio metoecus]
RTSLRKFDHIMLPFLQLHTAFPVHIAHERKIPLIIWGQNQAVEQVGKCSHYDAIEMTRWSRREHDLFNVEVEHLIGNGAQVDERHLNYYHYPKIELLDKSKIKGIYLSNYFRWDPLKQNHSVIKFGFIPQDNYSSFDIYERAGSSVYYGIHDILKYKRTGYRKISDHVAREIRHGRITTTQGRDIINTYTARKVFIKPFFDWLGVSNEGYEWFKMHRLDSVKGLISDVEVTSEPIRLPDSLNCMLQDSVCSEKNFIIYGKGVKI